MSSNSSISKVLDTIKSNSIKDEDAWYEGLEDRKKEEVQLHNKLRDMDFRKSASEEELKKFFSNTKMIDGFNQDGESLLTNNQLYFNDQYLLRNSISGLSDNFFNKLIRKESQDRIVLDMASGYGRESIIAAKAKAKLVVGIDLSPLSVREAEILAKKNNLDNVKFTVADCENLYFENETFDLVICARMLHHIDFEKTIKEVHRVLKVGGKVICLEALGINPILNLYRRMTPAQRTHWETANILTFKHIKIAKNYFAVENIQYWHMSSPLAKFTKKLLPILNFLDKYFFTKIPFLKKLAWTFTFELKKN